MKMDRELTAEMRSGIVNHTFSVDKENTGTLILLQLDCIMLVRSFLETNGVSVMLEKISHFPLQKLWLTKTAELAPFKTFESESPKLREVNAEIFLFEQQHSSRPVRRRLNDPPSQASP